MGGAARPASEALAEAAGRLGVRIAPGTRFGVGGAFQRFVRLPFTLPEADLEQAVDRLAEAWATLDRKRPRAARRDEGVVL